MINGTNLKLDPPRIIYKSYLLKLNPEINSLIKTIRSYFKQKTVIYGADLILSNNEYQTVRSDKGYTYRERIDYKIRLRYLEKIILYSHGIVFECSEKEVFKIKIGKDFFYSVEWEDSYYI